MIKIVSTANEEVDALLGGGLPYPSLSLIEGDNGTGKSAITAQFMKGMLEGGLKVLCITENTVKDYIERMKSITFDFTPHFLKNDMGIVSLHVQGTKWSEKQSSYLLPFLSGYIEKNYKKYNCVVIDSLSFLTMHANAENTLDFIKKCKLLVSNGIAVILTMHPDSIDADVALRIKSATDAYISLSSSRVGTKSVKIMKIIKMVGSTSQVEPQFAFDVDNIFGIKIVPISMANA